ncbi:ArsR/SmtB family transcription factor [Cohnella rhizosphaerae]|uniref:Metalloregulator ArsR/SmtB family transcription factor n=1 Tax=Cohnella rhizosphaerae TaxID=1457232 RepID=A0A9X4QVF8_9BACL|nr:metalloregulator ArsR/SmtB family transcription factor [Cohnella rhizosphaerae]MDG0812695.1 metalloregulator ArsR/SmtB family transcription factor [Cohnella rhizosphaerae]
MQQPIAEDCEVPCGGSEADLARIKAEMIREPLIQDIAEWFKALSDPTRVKIISALMGRELCVHDLSELLEMGQSAVSHQLRYLRNLRMVKRRKAGKTVYYSLDDSHIEEIIRVTLEHLKHK